jgi:hypothetical protein
MKLRYLVMLGVLVFLNGFVFTVLFLMFSREMASPAPTETATVVPTTQATLTSTPLGPTPTDTPQPTHTYTPEPIPTNTIVIVPPTVTHTNTPVQPTSTPLPPTATFTPGGPTETVPPPTATPTTPAPEPTSTPTMTPTVIGDWDFLYVEGSVIAEVNCGSVYLHGKITGIGGEPVDGRTVRLRWWDNTAFNVSGSAGGHDPGAWGFSPLSQEQFHSHQPFIVDIVESEANPVPISNEALMEFTDCGVAGQFTNITFAYAQ